MVGPRHHFLDPGPAEPSPVYRACQLTPADLAKRQQALAAELSKAQAETAALRHRLDVYERTTRTAVNLLSHLNGGRKP
jgi:hypothetical protein